MTFQTCHMTCQEDMTMTLTSWLVYMLLTCRGLLKIDSTRLLPWVEVESRMEDSFSRHNAFHTIWAPIALGYFGAIDSFFPNFLLFSVGSLPGTTHWQIKSEKIYCDPDWTGLKRTRLFILLLLIYLEKFSTSLLVEMLTKINLLVYLLPSPFLLSILLLLLLLTSHPLATEVHHHVKPR